MQDMNWNRLDFLVRFFAMLILAITASISTDAKAQSDRPNQQTYDISLGELLDERGNVSLPINFSGPIDPTGYILTASPGDAPRFIPAGDLEGEWSQNEFGVPGCSGIVETSAAIAGELFIGGNFTACGFASVSNIARFNTSTGEFSSLGSGLNRTVAAMAVIGTDLYVGGFFTEAGDTSVSFIAVYDTTQSGDAGWSALGSGVSLINSGGFLLPNVTFLASIGTDLYVGGFFEQAGGIDSINIAVYDTTQADDAGWSAFGSGLNGDVLALTAIGSNLYVGGEFTQAGGTATGGIAVYDTSQSSDAAWSALGDGVDGAVSSLELIGQDLYVGGGFTEAGGVTANHIAVYDTTQAGNAGWSALGSGVNGVVSSLELIGQHLYAGGGFTEAGGVAANHIAVYDTAQAGNAGWSALGSGATGGSPNSISKLTAIGMDLYVGGRFTEAGDNVANSIAAYDTSIKDDAGWSALGGGLSNSVFALAIDGTDLYVGGKFSIQVGEATAKNIAIYDTTQNGEAGWSTIGGGVDSSVWTLALIGTNLYVGGEFTQAGQIDANGIAVYDTTQSGDAAWSSLGSGVDHSVQALAVIGLDLYVGGRFSEAGGISMNSIAVYDTTQKGDVGWSALGSGITGGDFNSVLALTAINTDLYVGGSFTQAGGKDATAIAVYDTTRNDDTGWSALGSGLENGIFDGLVYELVSTGTDLYVGGLFTRAGGNVVSNIAVYDTTLSGDSGWSSLGSGIDGIVFALSINGKNLYVAGSSPDGNGSTVSDIVVYRTERCCDAEWTLLGNANDSVSALTSIDMELYAGGNFTLVDGFVSAGVARYLLSARISVMPELLDFGDQPIGINAPEQMVIAESLGLVDLSFGPINLQGPAASDYQIGVDTCSNASVSRGNACGVDVVFSVTEPGVRRAWIEIPSNAQGSPNRVELIGTNDVLFFDGFEQN